jgi:uncharacterized protein (DUF488 family)
MTTVPAAGKKHPPRIYTLGYEGLDVAEFLGLLRQNHVEAIIDVRATALSHKPGFSKTSLQNRAEDEGFAYHYHPGLGIPKGVRTTATIRKELWVIYESQILPAHNSDLRDVVALCRSHTCALICFERDAEDCHRSILAKRVAKQTSAEIVHLHTEPNHETTRVKERPKKKETVRRPAHVTPGHP